MFLSACGLILKQRQSLFCPENVPIVFEVRIFFIKVNNFADIRIFFKLICYKIFYGKIKRNK